MRFLVAILVLLWTGAAWAADAIVRDGNTLQIGDIAYRLNGIDAPEFDQMCIDEHADPWACGVDARDQLTRLIAKRSVNCQDLGPDKAFAKRHMGLCTVAGEASSLNQMLVRQGYAVNAELPAKARFGDDESSAKNGRLGLWKGCFVAPIGFRHWDKTAPLLGASCPSDKDRELREALFPNEPAMPPGCTVKAKYAVRARATGHVGIYHMQACSSYAALTRPDRWFCSAEDAQAAGFRKAFNCLARVRRSQMH